MSTICKWTPSEEALRGASDTAFPVTGNPVFARLDADARRWLKVRTREAPSAVAETLAGGTVLFTSSSVKSANRLSVFAAAQARYSPIRNMEGGGGKFGIVADSAGIRESATVCHPRTAGKGNVRERKVLCRNWLNSAGGRSETVRRLRRPPGAASAVGDAGGTGPSDAGGGDRQSEAHRVVSDCRPVGRIGRDHALLGLFAGRSVRERQDGEIAPTVAREHQDDQKRFHRLHLSVRNRISAAAGATRIRVVSCYLNRLGLDIGPAMGAAEFVGTRESGSGSREIRRPPLRRGNPRPGPPVQANRSGRPMLRPDFGQLFRRYTGLDRIPGAESWPAPAEAAIAAANRIPIFQSRQNKTMKQFRFAAPKDRNAKRDRPGVARDAQATDPLGPVR